LKVYQKNFFMLNFKSQDLITHQKKLDSMCIQESSSFLILTPQTLPITLLGIREKG
ncbi:hypothetical protein A5871_001921, partial [Enterococcus sp. 2F9_DIV0599]